MQALIQKTTEELLENFINYSSNVLNNLKELRNQIKSQIDVDKLEEISLRETETGDKCQISDDIISGEILRNLLLGESCNEDLDSVDITFLSSILQRVYYLEEENQRLKYEDRERVDKNKRKLDNINKILEEIDRKDKRTEEEIKDLEQRMRELGIYSDEDSVFFESKVMHSDKKLNSVFLRMLKNVAKEPYGTLQIGVALGSINWKSKLRKRLKSLGEDIDTEEKKGLDKSLNDFLVTAIKEELEQRNSIEDLDYIVEFEKKISVIQKLANEIKEVKQQLNYYIDLTNSSEGISKELEDSKSKLFKIVYDIKSLEFSIKEKEQQLEEIKNQDTSSMNPKETEEIIEKQRQINAEIGDLKQQLQDKKESKELYESYFESKELIQKEALSKSTYEIYDNLIYVWDVIDTITKEVFGYGIDHIESISEGFDNIIDPSNGPIQQKVEKIVREEIKSNSSTDLEARDRFLDDGGKTVTVRQSNYKNSYCTTGRGTNEELSRILNRLVNEKIEGKRVKNLSNNSGISISKKNKVLWFGLPVDDEQDIKDIEELIKKYYDVEDFCVFDEADGCDILKFYIDIKTSIQDSDKK